MADSEFKDKVIWITGASSGIGEALAKRFARDGARLILSSRREPELSRVATLCSKASTVWTLPLDLSNAQAMPAAVQKVLDREGAVDIMVHNAAVSQRAFAADAPYSMDELIMRTNYLGPIALTKSLLPSMRSRKRGHFIVVSSVLGKFGLPRRSGYCASKHALHGFFDSLRAEVADEGIRVTLVLPGWVRTNISINALTTEGPQGTMDPGTASGVTPEFCAEKIFAAAESGAAEVQIVQLKEHAALYVSRLAPGLFRRLIRGRKF